MVRFVITLCQMMGGGVPRAFSLDDDELRRDAVVRGAFPFLVQRGRRGYDMTLPIKP